VKGGGQRQRLTEIGNTLCQFTFTDGILQKCKSRHFFCQVLAVRGGLKRCMTADYDNMPAIAICCQIAHHQRHFVMNSIQSRSAFLFRASLVVSTLLIAFAARADVKLASPFTDHMILQQGMLVPVWL
jgi:hypothetical protein